MFPKMNINLMAKNLEQGDQEYDNGQDIKRLVPDTL